MEGQYEIYEKTDFDKYLSDFWPYFGNSTVRNGLGSFFGFIFVLRNARVVHTTFDGMALGRSIFWRCEGFLFRLAGIKVIVLSYGSDAYQYSKVIDTSLRYGLLASYPSLARREQTILSKVTYWNRRADIISCGLMVDGQGRWDITTNQHLVIDTLSWSAKAQGAVNDGENGVVRVLHTPNHRGFKGTEFLVEAVEQLKGAGIKVELIMLERVPNEHVRRIMQEVDILAEQFIATGYAMSGIEGMASGLPVLANLDHEAYTRVFRRYGFLDECPILSSPPERLAANLKLLIRNPALREELGRAGRAFVEKYHSYATAQYMFGSIYRRFNGEEVDLINLFHPLKSAYNRATPRIDHPLVENRLPASDPRWRC